MPKNKAKGVGPKRPSSVGAAPSGRTRRRRRLDRHASTVAIMDELLTRQVSIKISGRARRVTAAAAIVLQLAQKALAGNGRAWRALLKYQEFAHRHSINPPKLTFVDDDYTRAVATSISRNDE